MKDDYGDISVKTSTSVVFTELHLKSPSSKQTAANFIYMQIQKFSSLMYGRIILKA